MSEEQESPGGPGQNVYSGRSSTDHYRVLFAGSFQCRLATSNDLTNTSPTDRTGVYGTKGDGDTFAYRERRFDRIIRLSKPVDLRGGLIDGWGDCAVEKVQVDEGSGLTDDPDDPLVGEVVSLGNAKFDTHAGNKVGAQEAIIDFKLTIGNGLLTASAAGNLLCDVRRPDTNSWRVDYNTKKNMALHPAVVDPERAKEFNRGSRQGGEHANAYVFAESGEYKGPLQNVAFHVDLRIVKPGLADPKDFDWKLSLFFLRYDLDTLTGLVNGELAAKRKPLVPEPRRSVPPRFLKRFRAPEE
jgi:hypothetical protein